MRTDVMTYAEQRAKDAESLLAYRGLNLLHIRREVTQFLSLIGRDGIFDQYTVHDISHIDKMLISEKELTSRAASLHEIERD